MNVIIEFYNEYFVYFNLLFFILLGLFILNTRRLILRILKYFGDKQFEVNSHYEHDISNQTEHLLMRIYNKNIHDLRLSSFGYLYKSETIDVTTLYKNQFNLTKDHTITIQPRDYLELFIDPKVIRDKVFILNEGMYKASKMKAYVTDAMGITTKSNVPLVRTYIKKELKALKQEDKIKRHALKQAQKLKHIERLELLKQTSKKKLKTFFINVKIWVKKHF